MRPSHLVRLAIVPVLLVVLVTEPRAAKSAHAPSTLSVLSAPVPEDLDRLELVQDRAARSADATRDRQVRPAAGRLTGWFGERRGGHKHLGIDVDGKTGDPVVAAAWGTVSHAGPAPKGYSGYGQVVIIDHDGFQTLYAHLSRIDVAVGQIVRAGAGIGAIGTSGSVTGSHLHFEVHVGGKPVDPKTVLRVFD
jgi:murein DD-endopeptidase MepM/ murein hydrolase activator NlpD